MSTYETDPDREASTPRVKTTAEVRQLLQQRIHTALETATDQVIQAPTSAGKSYTIATTPWTQYPDLTGEGLVLHLSTTTEARNDAADKSENAGVDALVLKGRADSCPVAAGDYDGELDTIDGKTASEWVNDRCNIHHITFALVHSHLEDHYGGLPCCQDGPCNSIAKLRKVTQHDTIEAPEYDVVHATAPFAYVPDLVNGANIIFDEQPQFTIDFNQEATRRAATHEISNRSKGEVRWAGLVEAVRTQNHETLSEYRSLLEVRTTQYPDVDAETVDTLASDIARALSNSIPASEKRFVG